MVNRPILFVFGSARSGTTFVNALLRDYYDFGMCAEGQWVLPIGRRLKKYGDLADDANLERIISDIRQDYMFENFRSIYADLYKRPLDVTPADIRRNLPERTYDGVVYAAFFSVAEQLGKSRVGNKCPDYWRDLPTLLEWFPRAKFLHVIRDGRDVALSVFKRMWGEKTALASARSWVACQEATDRFRQRVPSDQYCSLHYERLLTNTEATIESLQSFLEAPLSEETRDSLIDKLTKSELRHNFDKWKKAMTGDDQRIYEAVAGEWLRKLGYETLVDTPSVTWADCARSFGREYYAKARLRFLSIGSRFPVD